jgi:hypothetical protein
MLPSILVAALGSALAVQTPSDSARIAGWRGDLEVWLRELQAQHYVLRRRPLPDSLVAAAGQFRAHIPDWSDDRALAELMRLAAMAGDGHTYVLPWGAARFTSRVLPLRFYEFSDGLFVIDADSGHASWIGAKVVALAHLPVPELIRRIRPYVARDNDEGIVWAGPVLLRFAGFLEAITDQRFAGAVSVRLHYQGRDTTITLPLVPAPMLRGVPKLIPSKLPNAPAAPLYLRDIATPYWFVPVGSAALYVQFNQVQDDPREPLAVFASRLASAITAGRPSLLIVDVRHNSGGNLGLLDPVLAVLRAYTSGVRAGRLVVISGRNTFSAGQVFLSRAEHEARAEVVGEPSSSKPNFVGEENPVVLPWSGALTSISNRYHETIPGDRRVWIEPRPRIELRSTDYFANRDPVVERILEGPRR